MIPVQTSRLYMYVCMYVCSRIVYRLTPFWSDVVVVEVCLWISCWRECNDNGCLNKDYLRCSLLWAVAKRPCWFELRPAEHEKTQFFLSAWSRRGSPSGSVVDTNAISSALCSVWSPQPSVGEVWVLLAWLKWQRHSRYAEQKFTSCSVGVKKIPFCFLFFAWCDFLFSPELFNDAASF